MNQSPDSSERVFAFVSELGRGLSDGNIDLPAFPDIALRVRRVLEDPETSVDDIVTVVSTEPVLAARLLRVANSALLSRGGHKVGDLRQAIPRLGFNMVRNAAMSVAMEQIFKARSLGALKPFLHELWEHSVRVAAIAHVLAAKLTRIHPDEALLAGLFHDIGKLYILMRAEYHPDLFSNRQVLDELMDRWHTGIGRAILEAWNISEEAAVVADEHEALDREHFGPPDLVDVVMAANLHAHVVEGRRSDERTAWPTIPAFKRLKLDAEVSVAVLGEAADEIKELAAALGG